MFVALATPADGDPLLSGLGLARVIERGGPVVKVTVPVQNAGQKQDGSVWAGGDPFAVAGEGVVSQQLVEVPVGPAVGGWFGQDV